MNRQFLINSLISLLFFLSWCVSNIILNIHPILFLFPFLITIAIATGVSAPNDDNYSYIDGGVPRVLKWYFLLLLFFPVSFAALSLKRFNSYREIGVFHLLFNFIVCILSAYVFLINFPIKDVSKDVNSAIIVMAGKAKTAMNDAFYDKPDPVSVTLTEHDKLEVEKFKLSKDIISRGDIAKQTALAISEDNHLKVIFFMNWMREKYQQLPASYYYIYAKSLSRIGLTNESAQYSRYYLSISNNNSIFSNDAKQIISNDNK